jgi:hypothetical protein
MSDSGEDMILVMSVTVGELFRGVTHARYAERGAWPAIAYYAVMAASIAVYFATLSWAERPHR